MPVKNEAESVGRAIISVRRQTLSDWRLLIYDNNSSDETLSTVVSHQEVDPRIVVHQSNQSLSASLSWTEAISLGLQEVNSEFVTMLAGDDFWLEDNYLETALLYQSCNTDLIIPSVVLLEKDGVKFFKQQNKRFGTRITLLVRHFTKQDMGNSVYSLFSRSLFELVSSSKKGKWRDGTGQDWWFVHTSLLYSQNPLCCSEITYVKTNFKHVSYTDPYYTGEQTGINEPQLVKVNKVLTILTNIFGSYIYIFQRPWRFAIWELPKYVSIFLIQSISTFVVALHLRIFR